MTRCKRVLHPRHPSPRRGVTLLLTLLVLAVLSIRLAQQAISVNTSRISSLSQSFALQSQWIADGVADQYLAGATDPAADWDKLLSSHQWQVGDLHVDVCPSSTENKISVLTVKPERWTGLWQKRGRGLLLAEKPHERLAETGFTALECLLDAKYPSGQIAYRSRDDGAAALADVLTVWGDGKIDLNRAPRDVLAAAFEGFTDAQIDGLINLRKKTPLTSIGMVIETLGLSGFQGQRLTRIATFTPHHVELVITIQRGLMQALYHAVIDVDVQSTGKVLELRLIQ